MNKREGKLLRKNHAKLGLMTKELDRQRDLRDKIYFEQYSKNEIHMIMCSDSIRVTAYKEALALLANEKSVLDIGSGNGVLSFAAVEGGAKRVYAVEKADVYKVCNKEIKKRGLGQKSR